MFDVLITGTIPERPPVKLNPSLTLQAPFNLHTFIKENRSTLETDGCIKLFKREDYTHQFQVSTETGPLLVMEHRLNTERTVALIKILITDLLQFFY